MACERFRDALKARAVGAPLTAEAAAHLAVCSACQATLEREERLHAAIASALQEVGAAAPSADFTARLRLAADGSSPGDRVVRRVPATAAVVVSCGAIVLALYAGARSTPRDAHAVPPPPRAVPSVPAAAHTAAAPRTVAVVKPKRATVPRRTAGPEVLVPRREREAVERLFASLRAGRPEVVSSLERLTAQRVPDGANDLAVPPIRIEPVAVPALPVSRPVER